MEKASRKRALYIRGGILAAIILAWLCIPAFKSRLSGMVMLFTQRSVQSLQGNINTAGLPLLSAFKQAVFHSAVMFFLPPRHIVAAAACLGSVMGIIVSVAGALTGAAAWYWLLCPLFKKMPQDKLCKAGHVFTAGLTGSLGGVWGPVMGICALLRLPFLRCITGMAAVGLISVVMYGLLCNPYSALLPSWAVMCLRIGGAVLLIIGVYRLIKK